MKKARPSTSFDFSRTGTLHCSKSGTSESFAPAQPSQTAEIGQMKIAGLPFSSSSVCITCPTTRPPERTGAPR
ncbi:MAG: hypothetical protein IPG04_17915 [Polyangiaceae bacterium]|nr:hypothetical protein [Polyangiaceae bacterium]